MPHPTERRPEDTALRVQSPLYGGSFTTDSGATLPFVLPGELVWQPLTILEPSPDRATPACDHFGACGGCHYQHANYPAQLALKRQILADLLKELGPLPAIATESTEPLGYRNRIRLRLRVSPAGALQAGYSRPASNEFLPIHMCPIAAPALWSAAQTLITLSASDPTLHRWLAIVSELELFTFPDESRLQLHFFLTDAASARREAPHFAALCDRLLAVIPALAGAAASLDPNLPRTARRAWAGAAWGAAGLNYPVAGRRYWLPRGAFFQVNRFLVHRLVELVASGHSGALAWDLYAGVGLFTRALSESFTRVVAVEGAEPAAAALATLKGNVEAVHASTLDFLRARSIQRERPSLIVLDPPRAGIGAEAAQILARLRATEIVYISCDPTSLARDLAYLTPAYAVASITLIDLFPQTFHLETVVHLKAHDL
jgi:23S rRNA (uracil1939-C5)-methyltransferase